MKKIRRSRWVGKMYKSMNPKCSNGRLYFYAHKCSLPDTRAERVRVEIEFDRTLGRDWDSLPFRGGWPRKDNRPPFRRNSDWFLGEYE